MKEVYGRNEKGARKPSSNEERGGGLPIVGGKPQDEMNNNRENESDKLMAVI